MLKISMKPLGTEAKKYQEEFTASDIEKQSLDSFLWLMTTQK